jgi:hypothetical protein
MIEVTTDLKALKACAMFRRRSEDSGGPTDGRIGWFCSNLQSSLLPDGSVLPTRRCVFSRI